MPGSLVRSCERILRWGLVSLLAFTPFAFGTVEPWAVLLMQWGVVTLVLVYALRRLFDDQGEPRPSSVLTGLEAPIALFLAFCLLQTIPMPLAMLDTISPGSAKMRRLPDVHALIDEGRPGAAEAMAAEPLLNLSTIHRASVSVRPEKTAAQALQVLVLALLFWLVASWAERGNRPVFLLGAIVAVGSGVAFEGLLQSLTWNGKIYWVRKVPPSRPFGPFVNHDHFAAYVEMVIPIAISMAFYVASIRRRPSGPPRKGGGLADALVIDADRALGRWSQAGIALFAAAILIATLFMSLSRGGIVSALASGAVLFGLLSRKISSRRSLWLAALGMLLLVALLILRIGGDSILKQVETLRSLKSEESFVLRLNIWERVLGGLPDFLWVGSGLGTFEDSFAPLAPEGSVQRWTRAHNDYLQIVWETGLVGAVIVLIGVILFVRRYWWPALKGRRHPLDLFRLGIAASLLSVALHSLVDFGLQIGANGFLFALLAGLMVALHRRCDRDEMERPKLVANGGPGDALDIAGPARAPYIH
jgi:O-Antigen ligase